MDEPARRYEPERRCGARTRQGGRCKRPAGAGTDHVGWGACKLHAGSTPSGRRGAHRARALAELPAFGSPIETSPEDALLDCVYAASGRVHWLRLKIEEEGAAGADPLDENGRLAALGRALREAERDRASFSKMALDAGVEERRVRAAERQGAAIASAFERAVETVLGASLAADRRSELVAAFRAQLAAAERGEPGDVEGTARDA
jgi:hypothetical protein